MVFQWFSKVRKFQFIFWTPLAFWASPFSILRNWRPPNLTYTVVLWIVTTGVREVFKKSEFVLWRPRRSFYFRRPVRTGVHFVTCNENPWARIEVLMMSKSWNGKKKWCSHVGLAHRNLENRERGKTVKILQWFSFNLEEAKMMVANLMPEVKNLDADHTFGDEAMKKTILAWEVLKKSRMCTGMRTAARKKVSATMRGSTDSLKFRKS